MRASAVALLLCAFCSTAAAQPVAPAGRTVEVFGRKIHYLGLGDTAAVWTDTIPAARFHVYAPDQIGFGDSDKPLINYRVQTLVDFLDGFYARVGLGKATLVGNSLGGWVAGAFAIAHPDKVGKLALVDPAGYWTGVPLTREWLAGLNPPTLAMLRDTLGKVFFDKSMITDAFVERAWTEQLAHGDGYTVSQFLDSFLRHEDDLEGRASSIKVPTLIVWGREDGLLPLGQGQAFAHDNAGAQLKIIDRCGHMPQVECPAALNDALLAD